MSKIISETLPLSKRLAIAGLVLCLASPVWAEEEAPVEQAPRPVVSILVKPASSAALAYTGIVAARKEVALGFPLVGVIATRTVDVGSRVKRDEVLAQLSTEDLDSDLRTAEAGVTVARAQLRTATNARDRAKQLADRGVGSDTRLEDAERSLVAANARLEQALSSRARAKDSLDLATLKAPFDGVVTEVMAEPGAALTAGQSVLRLAETGEREIIIDVSEADAALRSPGDRFTVRLLVSDTVTANAVLNRIDPVAERSTRTNRLHLTLQNPSPAFRLGALVRVEPDGGEGQFIVLPVSALLEPPAVWVVERTGNTVAQRPVVVSEIAGALAVVSSGLEAGDEVIIKGVNSLQQGQVVGRRVSE